MSTELIVRHCAPTLAGLKVGNLFSYQHDGTGSPQAHVAQRNRMLNSKGVYFVLIRVRKSSALVYVYRKKMLESILADPAIQDFLRQYGYTEFTIEACLTVLTSRLQDKDFPHDIGVFLGYPLEDIKAFIANKGANCKRVGYWKVYNNVGEAERTFARFSRCTQIYCRCIGRGTDITRLTVAG